MRTFSELLREYIGRTGVSDAELARAVGVQRQTVFRWKDGQVARPRSAEDVLHLAAKLRLTPAERDELLMAAGFPPVTDLLSRFLPTWLVDAIASTSFVFHFESIQRGILDLRDFFYFGSVMVFMLLATQAVLANRVTK
jgi:transcriptional regulator with XRE-family HTH domain